MLNNNKKFLIYFLVFISPFFLFFPRPQAFVSLKFGLVSFFSESMNIVAWPVQEFRKLIFYHRNYEEYRRMKSQVEMLKSRANGLQEVVEENARLGKLLQLKRQFVYSSVAAQVVARDPSRWSSYVLINKGLEDGIRADMPVVNVLGVIGKVVEVGRQKSKVLLLTDPQFNVVVQVQRSREEGVISGSLEGVCQMRYVAEQADIQVGDKIVTSKLSSSFPEGLLIGEVVGVVKEPSGGAPLVRVAPAVAFSQIEEVLIITK